MKGVIKMSKKYNLTATELKHLANVAYGEQGTVKGAAAEASIMCNLFEKQTRYTTLYNYVRYGGWFANAARSMDYGSSSQAIVEAVKDVICNGNRTLPEYVDEHDCFSDIKSISTGNKNNRSDYIKDETVIKNVYGSTYTFYCFPDSTADPFGYTGQILKEKIPEIEAIQKETGIVGVNGVVGVNSNGGNNMSVVEKAIQWMENLANDNSHGYDQRYRWGERGDFDCSSAVVTAWTQAGIPVKANGATYTGNIYSVFTRLGFKDVTSSVNLANGAGLVRGDILLNHVHHVAMYCGNGKEVEASINERGGATGGTPGDQTGREILIRSYRNYPWNAVLRWTGDGPSASGSGSSIGGTFRRNSSGSNVKILQQNLSKLGYNLDADGEFGPATEAAVKKFQSDNKLEVDGIFGPKSQAKLAELLAAKKATPKWVGKVTASSLNVRKGPGVTYSNISAWPQLASGNLVDVCDTEKASDGSDWYYIRIMQKHYGYVSAKYIQKV